MRSVVIIGIGELGAIFARGFLRLGHPVYPVTRTRSAALVVDDVADPALVLVAVGEADLGAVLDTMPAAWRPRVALVQNELLPRDWLEHGITRPTVVVVWFEKKPSTLLKQLLPSVVYGDGAPLVADALAAVGVQARTAADEADLTRELIRKNFYILTTNIAGLVTGGTVRELWDDHRDQAERVANDVIELSAALSGTKPSRADLLASFERAVMADPGHACTGRSAPFRLARALRHADALGLDLPELRRIAEIARKAP